MAATAPRTVKAYAAFETGLTVKPFEYVSRPLGPDDVEISISHCGVCGTDVHTTSGGWGPMNFPLVPGHEIVGTVTAVGANVTDLVIGDRAGVGPQGLSCLDKTKCNDCATDHEPLCDKAIFIYNSSKYEDGATAYGGFADHIRVHGKFAFKIPEAIPSEFAGPLLCAGVTVFKPLQEYVQPGQRVGIVGIGGLGHLAIQFAKALDAHPVAFSHSASKEQAARDLGAEDFVVMSNPDSVAKAGRSVDVLLVTADAVDQPFNTYLTFIKKGGKLVMVGVPNGNIEISPYMLLITKVAVLGSAAGGMNTMKEMLEVAAKKNVRPIIQKLPMSEASKALELVEQGKARYRIVLEN